MNMTRTDDEGCRVISLTEYLEHGHKPVQLARRLDADEPIPVIQVDNSALMLAGVLIALGVFGFGVLCAWIGAKIF